MVALLLDNEKLVAYSTFWNEPKSDSLKEYAELLNNFCIFDGIRVSLEIKQEKLVHLM